ncbi:glycosyltransferase [Aureimonas sp. AU22]|uniref:glycosyltransferase n=1 Tax=Aureimonas sp. AU22 TaxID=1638162 RepID=UPI000783A1F9|nr:glycosyltransferase [Aureimonas sp. AU22]
MTLPPAFPAIETDASVNVLHTITGLNVGGAEYMLTRFLEQLDRAAFSSTVLSLLPPGLLQPRVLRTRADVVSVDMDRRPRARDAVRLARLVGRSRPDLIHGWMYHGNVAATLGSLLGFNIVPIVWSIHHTIPDIENENSLTRRLIAISARLSSRVAAISYCSRVAADDHERLGFDPARRVVIPNGIDCAEFQPRPDGPRHVRQIFGIPADRLIVGHVARNHPMKNPASIVRAIKRLVDQGHDIQGIFIGDGHDEGPVRHVARELGIDARITTPGIRSDVADLLPGFDVFALSSSWGEAFSLAVGEAMACGVPAVVTSLGDCGWLVGPTGAVVPPGDQDAFDAGLERLVAMSDEDRRALGAKARQRVIENFSLAQYVSRHLDLYAGALAGRRSTASH